MKGSEIDDPGHLIGLKPRRFPNWGARQQPIKICPLCYSHQNKGKVKEIGNLTRDVGIPIHFNRIRLIK